MITTDLETLEIVTVTFKEVLENWKENNVSKTNKPKLEKVINDKTWVTLLFF